MLGKEQIQTLRDQEDFLTETSTRKHMEYQLGWAM